MLSHNESNSVRATNRLLAAGAKVNLANKKGRTALIFAATTGQIPVIRRLVKAGASLALRDKWGKSASQNARSHKKAREELEKLERKAGVGAK